MVQMWCDLVFCSLRKPQFGDLQRPDLGICGADDGIRTRDPHLGKEKVIAPDPPTWPFANFGSMIVVFG